jgi:hypothetical protein
MCSILEDRCRAKFSVQRNCPHDPEKIMTLVKKNIFS